MIKSIYINLNNTEICDDSYIFRTILKGFKYFLISIADLCKTVEVLEINFLVSNRNDKNEAYAEEIKTFLEVISEEKMLRESMRVIKFDSYAIEIMLGLIADFENLEVLKIIDCIFIEGEYLPLFKTKSLRELSLNGSHQIEYQHIEGLIEDNSDTLNCLKLDGENLDSEQLT